MSKYAIFDQNGVQQTHEGDFLTCENREGLISYLIDADGDNKANGKRLSIEQIENEDEYKQDPNPCPKDRACTFKDLQPCDDCEVGGDKELVEALERIAGKVMSMHLSESHMIKTMKRIAYQALAKHKAKNN